MSKKVIAIGLAVGVTLGAGGAALAYFTTTGSGTGTGNVGVAGSWTVGPVVLAGTAIYPGQGSNAVVSDTVLNPSGNGNQNLNQLQVTISSVSEGTAGTGFDSSESVHPCTTADFALTASSNWTVAGGALSATVTTLMSSTDIAPGNYYTDASGNSGTSANALPTGLALTMVDAAHAQDRCQGATVTLTLAAS